MTTQFLRDGGGRGPSFRGAGLGFLRRGIRSVAVDAGSGLPFTPVLLFPVGGLTGGTPAAPPEGLYGPGLMAAKGRPAVHTTAFTSFPGSFIVRFELANTLTGATTFAPTISFAGGTVVFQQFLTDTNIAFRPGLNFPQGNITELTLLIGVVFSPALSFPAGQVNLQIQTADSFKSGLTFPVGTISLVGSQTLSSGSVFAPSISFPEGGFLTVPQKGGGWMKRHPRHPGRGRGIRTSRLT